MIAHLKLQIAKLRREQYGARTERSRRLHDQVKLQLEDFEGDASEDDLAAEAATAKTTSVPTFECKKPSRKPFPEHLPRERVVTPAPCWCPACGGNRLSKLGEDVTDTLEVTGEFASRITRRNGRCAACLLAERHGCFAARIGVGSGPLYSTR